MTTSQNGWQAFADYGDAGLVSNPTVPGTDVKVLGGLRAGDVATVLLEVARRWNVDVEPLVQDQGCWGYQPRNIRGSTSVSNHASGTAIDLNAERHPLGTSPESTLSAAQIAAARRIRDDMGGVVRWGGDYSGRKDAMHWEINAGAAEVAALARQLTYTPPQPTPTPPAPETGDLTMAQIDDIMAKLNDINAALHAPAKGVVNKDGKPSSNAADILAALLRQSQVNFNQTQKVYGEVLRDNGISDEQIAKIAAQVAARVSV